MHAPFASPPLLRALRQAVLLGAALCLAPAFAAAPEKAGVAMPKAVASVASKDAKAASGSKSGSRATGTGKKAEDARPGPLADFGNEDAPADVVHTANWISYTRNNQKKAFVVIDKKQAELYLFEPTGKLKSRTPVLLGRAVGDVIPPGTASKPISQLKENEKTTPAGRFLAQPGKNAHGANVIWVDYSAAISMHRLLKVGDERRAERMATADAGDNRISNGCINVPPSFYDKVLYPTVVKKGAFVYVMPETRTPQQLFGSYDVADKAVQVVQAPASAAKGK